MNNTYTAEIDNDATTVDAVFTPVSGTVTVKDSNGVEVPYESLTDNVWKNSALPVTSGQITKYTLTVTNGSELSTVDYTLILKPKQYNTGLKSVMVEPLENVGGSLVGNGYETVTDVNENVYSYIITKELDYIAIRAEAVNANSYVDIDGKGNDTSVYEIREYRLDREIKDFYIPIDVTTDNELVEHYILHLSRKSIDDSIKEGGVTVEYGTYTYKPSATDMVVNGETVPVYVVKLDNPSDAPFTNNTYVNISIVANDEYTIVNAGSPTAENPTSANTNKWEAKNVLLDSKELTVYQIKTKAADLDTYSVFYLYIYKQSNNSELESLTATYTDDGTDTVVNIDKDENGSYQLWLPKDVTEVDINAVTKTLLAQVKIEDNEFKQHSDTYDNLALPDDKTTITVKVKPSASNSVEKTYIINVNRLNLDLKQVQVSPFGASLFENAVFDEDKNAYIVRLEPQENANALAMAFADDSNNYVRIGHLTRPEKQEQGNMSDEEYEAYLAQYEKERAEFNIAAESYNIDNTGIVWDGQSNIDGGWQQSSNQSLALPLTDKDGGFTMVKIQVGVANNYAGETLADKIGTIKTYNLLIGQKYKNVDGDIDIYINNTKMTNPVEEGGYLVYRYGISRTAPDYVSLRTVEHAPVPYDPVVSIDSVSDNGNVNISDYNPTDGTLTVPVYDAHEVSEDTPDTVIRLISIPEAGATYGHQYKVIIYRLSEDTTVAHNEDLTKTTVNETVRYNGVTSPKIVDYYRVSEATMTVDDNGNKYLRVFIKTTSDKATITLNGVSYVGETDDETVINGEEIRGILIPVSEGETVKVIPYKVTSEDKTHTVNNELNVTIQSINTDVDYVTVGGVDAFGPFEDEDTGISYFNSFISKSEYEKALAGSKTSIVVQAATQTKNTVAMLEDEDHNFTITNPNSELSYRVANGYCLSDVSYIEDEMPQQIRFRIKSEAGVEQDYVINVYLANDTNNNIEYTESEDKFSVWLGEVGSLNRIPKAEYVGDDTFKVDIETGITTVEMRVVSESEYAGIDIYDPYTGSFSNNYVLHDKTVQLSNLEPNQSYTIPFVIRTQDEMLSGSGTGREYTIILNRKSNNRRLDYVYAYPDDPDNFQSYTENILTTEPIVFTTAYGASIVPIEIGADYVTARVGITIDDREIVSNSKTLSVNVPFEEINDDISNTGEHSQTFTVKVWSYEGDINPAYYTLKLVRKTNNLKVQSITLDGRAAIQDENDPYTYRIDVSNDAELATIYAKTADSDEYVSINGNGYLKSENTFENLDVSDIDLSIPLEVDIIVGSPDIVAVTGIPDQTKTTKLIITKLTPDEVRSDLKLDLYVSNVKNIESSFVKSTLNSTTLKPGTIDEYVYNYLSFINPSATMAYIKSQTKSSTSKITFYTLDDVELKSGFLAVDAETVMSGVDDVQLKVIVTAGDGKTQDYTLTIQKSSSEVGVMDLFVDSWSEKTANTTRVSGTVTGIYNGVIEYRVELPNNSTTVTPFVFPSDPYAYVQFYDTSGKLLAAQQQGDNPDYPGATADSVYVSEMHTYTYYFRVTSRTNSMFAEYRIVILNNPEGTQITSVEVGNRNKDYVDYPIDPGQVTLTKSSVTGLTTFISSIPYIEGQDSTVMRVTTENKFATIFVDGVHIDNAQGVYIDDIPLNKDGLITEVPVTIQSPSGTKQVYTVYIVRYMHAYDLNIMVNHELSTKVRDDNDLHYYERPTPLPFFVNEAQLKIVMADPRFADPDSDSYDPDNPLANNYFVQVEDHEMVSVTSEHNLIEDTVALSGAATDIHIKVFDENRNYIATYIVTVRREMIDQHLGAILVNDNNAVATTINNRPAFEAYSYTAAENPTAKVQIYATNNKAQVTLTGTTITQSYVGVADGYLEAYVKLQEGDNFFEITIENPGEVAYYYTLVIKHIPVDVYLDDLYITKKDDSTKIPFYNMTFQKTIMNYTIPVDGTSDYDVYAKAYETKEALRKYAISKGWNENDYQTRIKITDAAGEQIQDLDTYIKQYVSTLNVDGNIPEYYRIPVYLVVPHYTRMYTIDVHNPSHDATLDDLQVIGYTLDPVYKENPEAEIYRVDVPSEVTNVDIFAHASHDHEGSRTIVSLLNKDKQSYANSFIELTHNVQLAYGNNEFYVRVTSEQSDVRDYVLHIYRKPLDANIDQILVNDMPAIQQEDGTYIAYVPMNSNPVVKAKADDSRAVTTISANGVSDAVSGTDNWAELTMPEIEAATTNVNINVNLTDSDITISKDYSLKLIGVTGDILSIFMDVDGNNFINDPNLPYVNPIGAIWNNDKQRFEISIPHNATNVPDLRVVTLQGDKMVKIGTLEEQASDEGTDNQFTAKTFLMNDPQEIVIKVRDINDTAGDNIRTYFVYVKRMSNDADLIVLDPEAGITLDPEFDSATKEYIIDVGSEVTNVTFDEIRASDNASIKLMVTSDMNSMPVINIDNGASYTMDDLAIGNNILKIQVTSEDKTVTKTYTVNVRRQVPVENATLEDIRVKIGNKYYSLVPMFDKDITNYKFIVEAHIDEFVTPIEIVATPSADAIYEIASKVNDGPIMANTPSVTINERLDGEEVTTVTFNITASGAVMREYTIDFYKNVNANINPKQNFLTSISLQNAELTMITGASDIDYNYYANVANTEQTEYLTVVPNTKVTGTVGDMTAYLYDTNNLDSQPVVMPSGEAIALKLKEGDNLFIVKVEDASGNRRYYSVTINRESSKKPSALLESMTVSGFDMTPSFDKNKTLYKMTVGNDVESISLRAVSENVLSEIWVRNEAWDYDLVNAGIANADNIPIVEGNNKLVITAAAPDKLTKKVYVLNVYRMGKNDNADLIDIEYTEGGIMTPMFDNDIVNYNLVYRYEVDDIELVPVARVPEIVDITVTLMIVHQRL